MPFLVRSSGSALAVSPAGTPGWLQMGRKNFELRLMSLVLGASGMSRIERRGRRAAPRKCQVSLRGGAVAGSSEACPGTPAPPESGESAGARLTGTARDARMESHLRDI